MPKITFATLETVPDGFKDIAKQEDGKYVIDVSPTAKLTEFRDNNVRLLQEADTMKAQLGAYKSAFGEDIAKSATELSELRGVSQQVKDGKLKTSAEIAAEVENRTKEARAQFETQLRDAGARLTEAEAKANTYSGKYRGAVRDNAISAAVMAADSGVNPQALSDILARAGNVFSVEEDGSLLAKKGSEKWYGADGTSTISVKEWLGVLLKEAPYLGKPSAGGGGNDRNSGDRINGHTREAIDQMKPEDRLNAIWNPTKAA